MSSLTAVVDVAFGMAGVLSGGIAVALVVAARRHPEAVPCGTRLIPAPRLLALVFGLLAAAWVALCTSRLAFGEDTAAQRTAVVVAWALFVVAALVHLKWLRPRHP